jgi:hypothetical protein
MGQLITDGAFGSPMFVSDFAMGNTVCGTTTQFSFFVSHRSSAPFLAIL